MSETESELIELKPCPFCGGKAEVKVMRLQEGKIYGVFCVADLGAKFPHGHFIDNFAEEWQAVEAWNRRYNDE